METRDTANSFTKIRDTTSESPNGRDTPTTPIHVKHEPSEDKQEAMTPQRSPSSAPSSLLAGLASLNTTGVVLSSPLTPLSPFSSSGIGTPLVSVTTNALNDERKQEKEKEDVTTPTTKINDSDCREDKQKQEQKQNLSTLVFEFCKADWNAKRYQLLKREAEDKRLHYHEQLVPFVRLPQHLQPTSGWKIDLSTLSKAQLDEIGGAGYIELRAQCRSNISVSRPTGALDTIPETTQQQQIGAPQSDIVRAWLQKTTPGRIQSAFLQGIIKAFKCTEMQANDVLHQCIHESKTQLEQETTTTIQVRRFAKGTNTNTNRFNNNNKRKQTEEKDSTAGTNPTHKRSKPSVGGHTSGPERLSVEEAERLMF